jgi:hypothetical protein
VFVIGALVLTDPATRRAWTAPSRGKEGLWLVGVFMAVYALFAIGVGGDWMPGWRLLVPVVVALSMLVGIEWGLGGPGGELSLRSRGAIVLVAVASLALYGTSWSNPSLRPFEIRWASMIEGLHDIGLWFRRSLPPGTLMATHPNGALSYYAELPVIDMLGLTDRHIAASGRKDPYGLPGHVSYDYAYVAERQPLVVFPSGEGFEKTPTAPYLRPEFKSRYRSVCFRHPHGTNPLGQYVNLLVLEQECERVVGMLLKDGEAEVVPCRPDVD